MPQQNDRDLRLAVLIDADNASRTAMRDVMAEIAVYGTPTIKRIYGDWTSPNMSTWKSILLETAITPIQQYSYTTGKNATDSAMIIDAMDILYTGQVDGFVLVSSDSDFTRLAIRLREAGKKVYGMGEKKTPNPFIVACDKFVYIESLKAAEAAVPAPKSSGKKKAADQGIIGVGVNTQVFLRFLQRNQRHTAASFLRRSSSAAAGLPRAARCGHPGACWP